MNNKARNRLILLRESAVAESQHIAVMADEVLLRVPLNMFNLRRLTKVTDSPLREDQGPMGDLRHWLLRGSLG